MSQPRWKSCDDTVATVDDPSQYIPRNGNITNNTSPRRQTEGKMPPWFHVLIVESKSHSQNPRNTSRSRSRSQ